MSDKIKTLSQAIRLGASFRPQAIGAIMKDGATCALGAAAEAVGLTPPESIIPDDVEDFTGYMLQAESVLDKLRERFPRLNGKPIEPEKIAAPDPEDPMEGTSNITISDISDLQDEIIHRNDHLHQTREQIADWLASHGL